MEKKLKRKYKNSNRIDEEQLCMNCFVGYLKYKIGCREIQAKREPKDPPDYWLKVDDKKFAVEVTILTKNAGYFPRCKRLAKAIEMEAKDNGWLCGKYILDILGGPEIPKRDSLAWKEIVKESLSYIYQTMNLSGADKKILKRDSKGVLGMEKLSNNGAYVATLGSNAKFEGQIQEELREIIQKSISMKRNILQGFLSYCSEIILLFYDAYIYADIMDVRRAFKEIEGIDLFHSIYWVQGLKRNTKKSSNENIYSRGYFLFSKDKSWFEQSGEFL